MTVCPLLDYYFVEKYSENSVNYRPEPSKQNKFPSNPFGISLDPDYMTAPSRVFLLQCMLHIWKIKSSMN